MRRDEVARHRFLVFGAARSGIGAARLLQRHGMPVRVADEKSPEQAAEQIAELDSHGIRHCWGSALNECLDQVDVMVISPGIPDTNPLVEKAAASGVRIISEIELAGAFTDLRTRLIAVTGTNGKTTTTAWIAHLLAAGGHNAVLAGNIGTAWSNVVDAPANSGTDTVFVVEVSSFQLERVEDFRPDVAVLTNLAPDHLDRYATYADYVEAKRGMLQNMSQKGCLVFNGDNADSVTFVSSFAGAKAPFSTQGLSCAPAAFVRDDRMCLRGPDRVEADLLCQSELRIPGRHNVENALAASLAALLAGTSVEAIARGLATFDGVEHRIEFCGESRGVRFFNDSKATNLDSLEKALLSFSVPIVLIAGGRDKHSDYDSLRDLVRDRVRKLVTIGEAAPLIEASWGALVPSVRASQMNDAVAAAFRAAEDGQVVLLSPACASFDMYANFEERGNDFKACVHALIEEQS